MTNYNHLVNNLEKLGLTSIRMELPAYLDEIAREEISFVDALCKLTSDEIEFQARKKAQTNIKCAAFPFLKSFDDFDFTFQPSINKSEVVDLRTLRFLEENNNIMFIGNSGVGKTHLACAVGIEAASKRYSTYFISCQKLISILNKAHYENKLEQKLRFYSSYRLLIVDEIGYLPVDKQGANLFFQLIARRYEKKSTIITTNKQLSTWDEVFGDKVIATAILDRLVHHSKIFRITGQSYRIKDKLKNRK